MENNELRQILDYVKTLFDDKIELIKKYYEDKEIPDHTSSENLNELFAALAKAQAEMSIAGLTNENPYFKSKYADLAEVVRASRPALTKNGLCVTQQVIINEDGQSLLHTTLGHVSGQWIMTKMRIIPPKNDIQTLGSYITYLRRYSYAALIGVVAGGEDDDGEVAMVEARQVMAKGTSLNTKYDPKQQTSETITKEQLEELEYELSEYPDLAENVMDGLRIQSLADMPKSKFLAAINRVREIKNMRNGKK